MCVCVCVVMIVMIVVPTLPSVVVLVFLGSSLVKKLPPKIQVATNTDIRRIYGSERERNELLRIFHNLANMRDRRDNNKDNQQMS